MPTVHLLEASQGPPRAPHSVPPCWELTVSLRGKKGYYLPGNNRRSKPNMKTAPLNTCRLRNRITPHKDKYIKWQEVPQGTHT